MKRLLLRGGSGRRGVVEALDHRVGDVDRVLRTGYYIDDFQATYFVIDRFEDLFELLKGTDFIAKFDELRAMPPHTPFEILPGDHVIRVGTGQYWRDFPTTKAKLK